MHRHRTYSIFFHMFFFLSFFFFFSSRRVPVYSNGDVVIFSSSVESLFNSKQKKTLKRRTVLHMHVCSRYFLSFSFAMVVCVYECFSALNYERSASSFSSLSLSHSRFHNKNNFHIHIVTRRIFFLSIVSQNLLPRV